MKAAVRVGRFGVQPVEQRLCLILARLAPAGWLIFLSVRQLYIAYFASCVCQDPPPVDTGHVGSREIEGAVCERKRGLRVTEKKFSPWKVVEITPGENVL